LKDRRWALATFSSTDVVVVTYFSASAAMGSVFSGEQMPEVGNLEGKVIIVTGGNAGIGFEACKALLAGSPRLLIVAARSEEVYLRALSDFYTNIRMCAQRGQAAVQTLLEARPGTNVEFMLLDLGVGRLDVDGYS
jgi:hypothetical protein